MPDFKYPTEGLGHIGHAFYLAEVADMGDDFFIALNDRFAATFFGIPFETLEVNRNWVLPRWRCRFRNACRFHPEGSRTLR